MSAGYTHTTISAHPGEPARVGVSFYLDEQAWIIALGRDTARPLLTVSLGEVSVTFSPDPEGVTGEDARMARCLADEAASYAAAVEELAAKDARGTAAA